MEGIKYYERIFPIDNQNSNLPAERRANDHRMAAKYWLADFLNGRTIQDFQGCEISLSKLLVRL